MQIINYSTTHAQTVDDTINVANSNPVKLARDIFYNKTGKKPVISTGAGGTGTVLTETTDWTSGTIFPDGDLPSSISPDVAYQTISIVNATYHSTLLYLSYYPIADIINAERWNEDVAKSETKLKQITDNYTVNAGEQYHIIEATLTTVDKTLTLPAASGIEGELYRVVLQSTTSAKLSFPVGTFKWKGQTIDPTLYEDGETIEFISDGTNLIVTRFDFDRYYNIDDQKTDGTGGGTFTSGTWQTRVLNTELNTPLWGASLATNQITLPAGKYIIDVRCPAFRVNSHNARVYNITDTSLIEEGQQSYSDNVNFYAITKAELNNIRFEITASKVIEIQHQCQTTFAGSGFGGATSFTTDHETYTTVRMKQVLPL